MRALFLGQGPIAAACLDAIWTGANGSAIVGLVVDDDIARAASAGDRVRTEAILSAAARSDADIVRLIERSGADCLLSVQYPWILPRQILETVDGRALNLHNARLPEYRGHNALTHVLLSGDAEHVVTLHWMAPVVDRGLRCLEARIPVADDETALSLWTKSVPAAVELVTRALCDYEQLLQARDRPIEGEGRYYSRSSLTAIKRVPASADLASLDRHARAFHFPPHEPAYFEHPDGRRTYLVPQPPRSPSC